MEKLASESDYTCPICQEAFNDPYSLPCSHNFCKACVDNYISQQTEAHHPLKYVCFLNMNKRCPLCSASFSAASVKSNKKLTKAVKEHEVVCECGTKVKLADLAAHRDKCAKYQKVLKAQTKKMIRPAPKDYVNRSTFACPFCEVKNMSQPDIVKHVTTKHRKKAGV